MRHPEEGTGFQLVGEEAALVTVGLLPALGSGIRALSPGPASSRLAHRRLPAAYADAFGEVLSLRLPARVARRDSLSERALLRRRGSACSRRPEPVSRARRAVGMKQRRTPGGGSDVLP